ncbi:hypothetical protein TrRE_jg8413 [Triparma retinervis]|uniref:peptidylprolyl isomerase n=1 Tax=Triparma retinervis TaxID=2557542 RepID=A0A9W6ZR73_9STRA|nr:hypothetical protein TrRE_jg8413 [Triparma retinervis]
MSEHFVPPQTKFVAPDPEEVNPKYSRPKANPNFDEFDPASSPFTSSQGYFDITPSGDGGVLKLPVHVPSDPQDDMRQINPVEGCMVDVQYVGKLLNGEIFDTTRDIYKGVCIGGTDDPKSFMLLREKVVQGFDMAVATMVVGEISSFVVRADYGYNSALPESLPKVGVGDTLIYEIELMKFNPQPTPRFPSQEELAISKKERQEEAEEELRQNPPIPYPDRCKAALEEKENGNKLFQEGDYEGAKKCYDSGFVNIFIHRDEWAHLVSKEDKKMFNDVKGVLHLNRCMCRVKMEKWDDAIWDADRSIEFKPDNKKAHYRRCLIYTGFLTRELDKETKGAFWDIEKAKKFAKKARDDLDLAVSLNGGEQDAGMKRAERDLQNKSKLLKKYEGNYKVGQKKLYAEKMMGTLNEKYEKLKVKEAVKKKNKEKDELDDMPELDDSGDEEGPPAMPPPPPSS